MMTDVCVKENERIDELQRNGYKIIQNPEKFCFGMDAVLLSGFARAQDGDAVLDMGTGNGILPLLMEAKTGAGHLTGLEIQEYSADMARRSVALNHLENKITIVEGDIKEAGMLFKLASFDVITVNPPYITKQDGLKNLHEAKTIARHEVLCTLEDIIRESAKLLRPGGNFFLVHRPYRLVEIMVLLREYRLEPKRLQFVHPFVDKEPNMVLLEANRGGRQQLRTEPPLIIYKEPGVYMDEIYDIYGY